VLLLLAAGTMLSGCHAMQKIPEVIETPRPPHSIPPHNNMPRELAKTTLPEYTIEPPDILTIDAVRLVPRPPYRVNTLDVLSIDVPEALPDAPIGGTYTVEPGGTVNLGIPYGVVPVTGLTLPEVRQRLEQYLRSRWIQDAQVSVTLVQLAGMQTIAGQHLVALDGTVTLGSYGSVYLVGMTLRQAKAAIDAHLSYYLEDPDVSVTVFAYNSKVYYVITSGAGLGDGVYSFPITGNETVLDAIARINGLTQVSSKRIWIARPQPEGPPVLLKFDWHDVTAKGLAETNYQLLPGDRLYVAEDKLVALDTALGKIISPIERVFGVTILGTQTISGIKFFNQQGGTGGFGGGVGP
jgi:polysaccharide export outer membrane protein